MGCKWMRFIINELNMRRQQRNGISLPAGRAGEGGGAGGGGAMSHTNYWPSAGPQPKSPTVQHDAEHVELQRELRLLRPGERSKVGEPAAIVGIKKRTKETHSCLSFIRARRFFILVPDLEKALTTYWFLTPISGVCVCVCDSFLNISLFLLKKNKKKRAFYL